MRHAEAGTRWGAVIAVALGVVLVALDMTAVAVLLPTLGSEFEVGPSATQWVILGYSLPLVALSIPAGRWLDGARLRPAFLLAIGGFATASALIAVAPSLEVVLLGRALQGLFGALIGASGMPIIATSVRPDHRARAMSITHTLIPLSGIAGPAAAGLITDLAGWRAVFLINVPIALAAARLASQRIPDGPPGRQALPRPGGRVVVETALIGAVAAGVFGSLYLVSGANDPHVILAGSLLALAVVAGVGWSRMPEARPALAVIGHKALAMPLLALPLSTAGLGAVTFLTPYLLTDEQFSARTIGLVVLALSAGMAVTSSFAGILADLVGLRPVLIAGAAAVLVGTLTLLLGGGDAAPIDLGWRLGLLGMGHGLFAGPNSAAILGAAPRDMTATVSGVTSLLRTLGFATGPAVAALCWAAAGGGAAGFAAGVAAVAVAAAAALVATLAAPRAGQTQRS